jgi:hypothetical protein
MNPSRLAAHARKSGALTSDEPRSASRLFSWACVTFAVLMLLGAVGPWVDVGQFTLSGFEGIGVPLVLLAGLAVGVSALQLSTRRRGLFMVLATLGLLALGCSAVAWALLKLFSGSAHLLSLALARGAHRAAFERHSPAAAWGLWLLPLSAASLTLSAFAGAAVRATPRRPFPVPPPQLEAFLPIPPTQGSISVGPDQLPSRWR